MDINYEINRLLNFAQQHRLLEPEDQYYAANRLLDCLGVSEYTPVDVDEHMATPDEILDQLLDYAVAQEYVEDTMNERDLFDTRLMDCVMPRPSEVVNRFRRDYGQSPMAATDAYYDLSIVSNYIRKSRIDKNIAWKTATEYGDLDVTINLSKPEKDPRDIAKAKLAPASSYPKCLLCKENEGYAGRTNHPARQTLRLIPLELQGHDWFLQYSPYTYYNEHCIILNKDHVPMKITKSTFANLCDFLDVFPHYFAGSNADLPIVGGSILSHDHYQGGRYTFAMEVAPVEKTYSLSAFPTVEVGRVAWPMSVLRLRSQYKEDIIALGEHILSLWRAYSDPSVHILHETDGTPHNTITPIARRRDGAYEFDLVLRNNRTTAEHPLGLFHPHDEVHHIKKENIGLIEVLGLAILPARLKEELGAIREALRNGIEDVSTDTTMAKHAHWYSLVRQKHEHMVTMTDREIDEILQQEVGQVFLQVLLHAGVFKRDAKGMEAFDRFVMYAAEK